MRRGASEFLPLPDEAARAVAGPGGRHAALIEDAFHVLIETPGGGVAINGQTKDRHSARTAVENLARRVAARLEITTADVRVAIDEARTGGTGGAASPTLRRGAVATKTAAQARYLEALAAHELVFALGPAGTGKTFLAVAHGASLLRSGEVERLVVTRPAIEAGERLGFLPGDLAEKVDPYMAPVWEAMGEILGPEALRRRRDRGEIEVAPIAFMRGRTLAHAFVIVDEAQNASRLQMKMVLTRLGEGSRMAVTGDPSQVDLLNPADSGLVHAAAILDGVEGVAITRFAAADVVRHPLVGRMRGRLRRRHRTPDAVISVQIADRSWTRALPKARTMARQAARLALVDAGAEVRPLAILLTDDGTLCALNARFRGQNAATNVLAFPRPAAAPEDDLGDIALAFGVCAREAGDQEKPLADHLRFI